MVKSPNNSIFRYLLVLSLSFTLMLSQTDRLHIHLEHEDHPMSSEHIVHVHPELTLHDFGLENHHDGNQDNHSAKVVDMSSDKLLKKMNLFDPIDLILLFIALFLIILRLSSVSRHGLYNTPTSSYRYLLQPPLRAPPIK